MPLEEENLNQNEGVRGLLKENHKAELGKILAFGEKYKEEGEMMRDEFWKEHDREQFRNLIRGYEESKRISWELFSPEERDMLDSLDSVAREKFYREYLYEKIFYNGNLKKEYKEEEIQCICGKDIGSLKKWVEEQKDKLKPGMKINLSCNEIGEEGVKILARAWKDILQPGMRIDFSGNKMGDEGVKILAREWKNKLKSGMAIYLDVNKFGLEGVETLVKEWKNSLQPGMEINLSQNRIGDEGVKILAREWKDKLKPGMRVGLLFGNIGPEGLDTVMKNLELKDGVCINLRGNKKIKDILKDKKRREKINSLIESYKNRRTNCEVWL